MDGEILYWELPSRSKHITPYAVDHATFDASPFSGRDGTYKVYVHYLDTGNIRELSPIYGERTGTVKAMMLSSFIVVDQYSSFFHKDEWKWNKKECKRRKGTKGKVGKYLKNSFVLSWDLQNKQDFLDDPVGISVRITDNWKRMNTMNETQNP